ncbi:DNA polymerase III subunit delta [Hyphomicrobium nitrativorans NL23]|uniref:DNA-directed DNA polymerase n=1 Tax=Hyphomicrobium nitrativorans NL23 TaxID=1029756 RepID=V5S9Q4_9HYPH|nr:DNA polymerase III subunit delta [Hyphomicrobium nitrativorans]AHB47471.1 DNA polymerase III subunit delta [Hyphomicrobium nitrativorans NL23]
MVAVKAHQAQAFLSSPDPKIRAVLFFGSDVGLVAERAAAFAKSSAARTDPAGELLRLDDADLDGNPERLIVELGTVPMFGGPKIVRVTAGRRINAAALRPLIDDAALEGMLIVEAGNLKPDEALRALFEKAAVAAAVACYADAAQDLEALIRDMVRAAGTSISADARHALVERLGADRALSRGEIEKLLLYVGSAREITLDDVEAVVGDVSELALERITFAAAAGDTSRAVGECGRAVSSGESPQAIIAALQRHFQRLHRVRAAVDSGSTLDDALRRMRPPLHFKQKDAFAAQCRLWTSARLTDALGRISTAAKAARLTSALEEALSERLAIGLAMMAREGSGRDRR